MKRILTFMLAFVMIAALSVSAFAVEGIPSYDGNFEAGPGANAGEINANKHSLIQAGSAGELGKDTDFFNVPGVQGDAVPTIDGVLSDDEGYADMAGFEDYLYIGANAGTYTAEEFNAWYDEVEAMNLVMKYCWDGNYIYFYIEYTVNDYLCSANTAMDLWKHNCIQLGLAPQDALVSAEMSETIFGVNAFTEQPMSGKTGAGNYVPEPMKDYMGSFAQTNDGKYLVKHEIRANICEALTQEETAQTGDIVKTCVVIQCSTKPGNSAAQRFLSFGHGITGQESAKMPNHFINLMLGSGYDPNVQEGYEAYYTPTAEEKECDYRDSVSFFFHQIKDTGDFTSADGTYTPATGDELYAPATFSTEAEFARFTSAKYPAGLWAGGDIGATHAVIRYRTTDEMTVGINMINNGMMPNTEAGETEAQFIPEATAYPIAETPITADGEWHDAIIKLSDCTAFVGQIVKTGIEISAGSIEIESIKFFGWDPSELYGIGTELEGCWCDDCEAEDCPCAGECDPDLCDCNCDFDGETDEPVDEPVDTPTDNTPGKDETNKDDTTDKKDDDTSVEEKKDGCKASIAAGAALVVAATIASGAVVLKKKED